MGGAILDRFMSAVQEIADARGMLMSNVVGTVVQVDSGLVQVDPGLKALGFSA